MDMANIIEISLPIIVVAIVVIVYLVFPRVRGLHYTSRLTCPKCGKRFDYNWVPGGSFDSVRLATKRYIQCPSCHEWSTFEIVATRTNKTGSSPSGAKSGFV